MSDRGEEAAGGNGVLQRRKLGVARRAFLRRFETLTDAEVAAGSGRNARDASSLANRWRRQARVLVIPLGTAPTHVYPAFQFARDGQPLPVIRHLLRALPRRRRGPSPFG